MHNYDAVRLQKEMNQIEANKVALAVEQFVFDVLKERQDAQLKLMALPVGDLTTEHYTEYIDHLTNLILNYFKGANFED